MFSLDASRSSSMVDAGSEILGLDGLATELGTLFVTEYRRRLEGTNIFNLMTRGVPYPEKRKLFARSVQTQPNGKCHRTSTNFHYDMTGRLYFV